MRAFRGLRGFRGHSSLGTWLYRIGVNVCLNRVSAKTLVTEDLEARQHVDARSGVAGRSSAETRTRGRVRAAIAQLPRKQRATLVLRIYHELSHQEIADVLGSSVGAVKANFFHALGNLKKTARRSGVLMRHLTTEQLVDLAEGLDVGLFGGARSVVRRLSASGRRSARDDLGGRGRRRAGAVAVVLGSFVGSRQRRGQTAIAQSTGRRRAGGTIWCSRAADELDPDAASGGLCGCDRCCGGRVCSRGRGASPHVSSVRARVGGARGAERGAVRCRRSVAVSGRRFGGGPGLGIGSRCRSHDVTSAWRMC